MKIKVLIILSVSLYLSACANLMDAGGSDKFSQSFAESHLIVNQTTEDQVRQVWGEPDDISTTNNTVSWTYSDHQHAVSKSIMSQALGYVPGLSGAAALAANSAQQIGNAAARPSHGVATLYLAFDKSKGSLKYYNLH